ncbi:MAG: PD-(D/E)XK nuclease family protein [Phycisphaerales bacterium]
MPEGSLAQQHLDDLGRFVADTDDLRVLEDRIGRFNVFDVLKIKRTEIRHSNFLAWLLDPSASHDQGDAFLKPVLMELLRTATEYGVAAPHVVEAYTADLSRATVERERERIDLLLRVPSLRLTVVIENKIDSGEHSNQLTRYEKAAAAQFPGDRRVHVFLTTHGDQAEEDEEALGPATWVPFSYKQIVDCLRRALGAMDGHAAASVRVFVEQYLQVLEGEIMSDQEVERLCRSIFAKHGRAIRLIMEHAGSWKTMMRDELTRLVEQDYPGAFVHAYGERETFVVPRTWMERLAALRDDDNAAAAKAWLGVLVDARDSRVAVSVRTRKVRDVAARNRVLERLLVDGNPWDFSTAFSTWRTQARVLLWNKRKVVGLGEDDEPDPKGIAAVVYKEVRAVLERLKDLPAALTTA